MNKSLIAKSYLFIDTFIGGLAFVVVAALIPLLYHLLFALSFGAPMDPPICLILVLYIYSAGPWLSDVLLLRLLPSLAAAYAISVSARMRKSNALRISLWTSWAIMLAGLLCLPPWPVGEGGIPYFDPEDRRGGCFFLDLPGHTYRIDTAVIVPLIGLVAQVAVIGAAYAWRWVTGRTVSFSETMREFLPALIVGFGGGFFLALVLTSRVTF